MESMLNHVVLYNSKIIPFMKITFLIFFLKAEFLLSSLHFFMLFATLMGTYKYTIKVRIVIVHYLLS